MMTLAEKREKTNQYNNKNLDARKKKLLDHFKTTPEAALSIKSGRIKVVGGARQRVE